MTAIANYHDSIQERDVLKPRLIEPMVLSKGMEKQS